jgi:UDP-GlcNAc:undecaprenyl-phosphate/decaprenyl-phosphate GlcNAc-1-phosphate transferase
LIIPLFDTMRVFLIRIINGKSPFKADNNHVHHKLLALGLTHLKATLYILGANLIIIILVLCLNRWPIIYLMMLSIFMAAFFSTLPEYIFKRKEKKLRSDKL